MNEGTLYNLRGRIVVGPGISNCGGCGDNRKTPYRYRKHGCYYYIFLPCYVCRRNDYYTEAKKYPPVDPIERWVNIANPSPPPDPLAQAMGSAITLEQLAAEDSDEP